MQATTGDCLLVVQTDRDLCVQYWFNAVRNKYRVTTAGAAERLTRHVYGRWQRRNIVDPKLKVKTKRAVVRGPLKEVGVDVTASDFLSAVYL